MSLQYSPKKNKTMKTSSKIFAVIFFLLDLIAVVAAMSGATHHWFTAAICTIILIVISADILSKDEIDNTPRLFS